MFKLRNIFEAFNQNRISEPIQIEFLFFSKLSVYFNVNLNQSMTFTKSSCRFLGLGQKIMFKI